jgi:hypothetical protein
MGTARYIFAGFGSRSNAIAAGGLGPPSPGFSNLTEEYNSTIFSPATGAWASGGNLNTARYYLSGTGTQTAGLRIWWIYYS